MHLPPGKAPPFVEAVRGSAPMIQYPSDAYVRWMILRSLFWAVVVLVFSALAVIWI